MILTRGPCIPTLPTDYGHLAIARGGDQGDDFAALGKTQDALTGSAHEGLDFFLRRGGRGMEHQTPAIAVVAPLPRRHALARVAVYSLTGTPRSRKYSRACPTVYSPKWKIEAASTASAPPWTTPS
jgi:hypothetical protein